MVVISLFWSPSIGVTQERVALPSTSTVQAPHCANPQPAIELAIGLQAAGQPRRLLSGGVSRIERESDHDRAEPGGELAAIESGSDHGQVLPLAWAARNTALMMRLWVPQRQRLPSSAVRTSCSLGRGLRSRSSFADMIMPLMQ